MYNITLRPIWVSKEYRDFIIAKFAPLTDGGQLSDCEWDMLQYLLLTPRQDNESYDDIVVASGMVRNIYHSKESTYKKLIEFGEKFGIEMNIRPYSRANNKARMVCPEFSDTITLATIAELQTKGKDKVDRVRFTTGEPWTMWRDRKERQNILQDIQEMIVDPEHPAYKMIGYLQSDRVENWLYKQINLKSHLMREENGKQPNEKKRLYADRIINAIENHGYVGYQTVKRSVRIFAIGINVLGLPKKLRNIFYGGTISLDIKNCQASIAASIWNLPKLKAFLAKDGSDFWKELLGYCKLENDLEGENKGKLKGAVYSLLFGMQESGIKGKLTRSGLDYTFLSHPFIKELLPARDAAIYAIAKAGGAYNAFGEWLSIDEDYDYIEYVTGADDYDHKTDFCKGRCVLALVIQSMEMYIMLGGFEYVESNKNLLMVGFLHDSMILTSTDRSERRSTYIDKTSKAIIDRAKTLNIELKLDIEIL